MNIAARWAFGLEYEFTPVRPVLFSFIVSLFLRITQGELLPRLFISLLSIGSVIGVYYLGKETYDKNVGLLSSFIMSVFYLNLFFSTRLIVDIPSLTFFIFASLFFYRYLKNNSVKSLYIAAALISIGTMFKQSTGFLLIVVFLYLLFTKGYKIIFKKELYIAAIIFFLVMSPYLLWGYSYFGGFVLMQGAAEVAPQNMLARGYEGMKGYFSLFPGYLSWSLLILFLIGIGSMYNVLLGFDLLHKKGNPKLKRNLFLILLFLIPIILASFTINHNEDRYIINSMPAIFIVASYSIFNIYSWLKKQNKALPIILLITFIGYFGYFQLVQTDSLIRGKLDSYGEIRDAAFWLKENSAPEDVMATASIKQVPYYSSRKTVGYPANESEFEKILISNENIKFLMVSAYEPTVDWVYSYPQRKNLTAVTAFFNPGNKQQPVVIIYSLDN